MYNSFGARVVVTLYCNYVCICPNPNMQVIKIEHNIFHHGK